MTPLVLAAYEIHEALNQLGRPHCLIGGFALLAHGEPRLTRDIDLSVFTGFQKETEFAEAMLARFDPRISSPIEHALKYRVLLILSSNGVPVDIGLAAFPIEETIIHRSQMQSFSESTSLPVATAEDLIVLKAFAGRSRDWEDIRGVIARNHSLLDWGHIESSLVPLLELKESPESLAHLQAVRDEVLRALRDLGPQ